MKVRSSSVTSARSQGSSILTAQAQSPAFPHRTHSIACAQSRVSQGRVTPHSVCHLGSSNPHSAAASSALSPAALEFRGSQFFTFSFQRDFPFLHHSDTGEKCSDDPLHLQAHPACVDSLRLGVHRPFSPLWFQSALRALPCGSWRVC